MQGIGFSASSLQDFLDCERLYQLRYVFETAWPAADTNAIEEQEEHVRLGRDLHRLIQQHLTGIPEDSLSASVHDHRLEQWWHAYLRSGPDLRGLRVIPELTLSASLAGHRLSARYDALALSGESQSECAQVLIFDWKTYRSRPSRDWLAGRIQSQVYPFVLASAGASLNAGLPLHPEQIEMQYWLAGDPTRTERLAYGQSMYEADGIYLQDLVGRIVRRSQNAAQQEGAETPWSLTSERRLCRHCAYRSLCGRCAETSSASEELTGDDLIFQDPAVDPEQPSHWCQVEETVC